MSRYIIKNCPSCRYTPKRYIDGIDYICWNAQNFNSSVRGLCQDCTDCKLKQIVELCKENLNSLETYVDVRSLECVTLQNILKLLDIQEVE